MTATANKTILSFSCNPDDAQSLRSLADDIRLRGTRKPSLSAIVRLALEILKERLEANPDEVTDAVKRLSNAALLSKRAIKGDPAVRVEVMNSPEVITSPEGMNSDQGTDSSTSRVQAVNEEGPAAMRARVLKENRERRLKCTVTVADDDCDVERHPASGLPVDF